jgi:hypothetical protein
MKNHILKIVFFFLIAYSSTAQSVLNLLDTKPAQIESYNSKNELTGSGMLHISSGTGGYVGHLRDEEGQNLEYNSLYDFKNTKDGVELALRFYINPLAYSPDLEVDYEGQIVLFPTKLSVGQTLPEANGMHTFIINEKPFITEKSKLTNRKVTGTEEIDFRGIKSTAYIVSSTYEAERIHRVSTTRSTDELKEWYIPGTGIVKSERRSNNKSIVFRLK